MGAAAVQPPCVASLSLVSSPRTPLSVSRTFGVKAGFCPQICTARFRRHEIPESGIRNVGDDLSYLFCFAVLVPGDGGGDRCRGDTTLASKALPRCAPKREARGGKRKRAHSARTPQQEVGAAADEEAAEGRRWAAKRCAR